MACIPVQVAHSGLRGAVLLAMAAASYYAEVRGPPPQSPPNRCAPCLRGPEMFTKAAREPLKMIADLEESLKLGEVVLDKIIAQRGR